MTGGLEYLLAGWLAGCPSHAGRDMCLCRPSQCHEQQEEGPQLGMAISRNFMGFMSPLRSLSDHLSSSLALAQPKPL